MSPKRNKPPTYQRNIYFDHLPLITLSDGQLIPSQGTAFPFQNVLFESFPREIGLPLTSPPWCLWELCPAGQQAHRASSPPGPSQGLGHKTTSQVSDPRIQSLDVPSEGVCVPGRPEGST